MQLVLGLKIQTSHLQILHQYQKRHARFWTLFPIPEDIYNTDEVLSQILKSSVKMDGLLDKLGKLDTREAAEKLI